MPVVRGQFRLSETAQTPKPQNDMKYATPGSVSHGTLRPEDLLQTFAEEIKHQLNRNADLPLSFRQRLCDLADTALDCWLGDGETLDPEKAELIDDLLNASLPDALQEFAPPHFYFGAHPGDGADFGFWLNECALQDFDGLKVNDTSEVPNDYVGEVLHVNDHGNMTLYASEIGKLREIWAVV